MKHWGCVGCWLVTTITAKLVVDQNFLENFDGEIVKKQGVLVNTEFREHSTCPCVEEKVGSSLQVL